MTQTIQLHKEETWPDALIAYLTENQEVFVSWEFRGTHVATRKIEASEYDQTIYGLKDIMRPYHLHGYHCTKLTKEEILTIKNNGMSLQDRNTLSTRIDALLEQSLISHNIAERLKSENQADDEYRAHILWFCFFEPHLAGEDGIERFFRSWGGEALYNSHEDDPETGNALLEIGIPCIIEADVAIASKSEHSYLSTKTYRNFLKNRGFDIRECCDHEGYAKNNIPAENIRRIIQFPDQEFIRLTQCDEWEELLN